ncbi:MAG: universal stress protein [Proteobacteria bacterium]|nr:universal stress protein [Pseudomonadota bacterium]
MIFSEFQLGPHTLKNRLIALPVFTGYALPDGQASDMLVDHYAHLAGTGVALVVVANAAVSVDGMASTYNLRADSPRFLPGLKRLARAIRKGGALACLQLNHAGRFAITDRPLQPSALDSAHLAFNIASLKEFMNFFPLERRFRLTHHFLQQLVAWNRAMTPEDRERTIENFGEAAAIAYQAGFDMVELHGATGYLLAQFLSPFTHSPHPDHGNDFETRVSFPLEVFREVKHRLPRGFPVGFRLLLREWVPEGIDLPEALTFAEMLSKEGVAYLSPSAGTYNSMFRPHVRKLTFRPGYLQKETAILRRKVGIPTVISGRVITPAIAERLLQEGVADLVGLGRPLRTDFQWIRKAQRGERVNLCINCNTCLKRVVLEQGFNCSRWPRWLQERTDLEHKLLGRGMFKGVWVVANVEDIEILRASMPLMVPARHGISATILFLITEENILTLEPVMDEVMNWGREMWKRRGYPGGELAFLVKRAEGALEEVLRTEVDQGGYGAVLMGRNPKEHWRERFLHKQRHKVVGLHGLHPHRTRVLVPVDLSPTTLLVMRYLAHSLAGKPDFDLTFVHVLQGSEAEGMRRWGEMRKIVGWGEDFDLRLLPSEGAVAADLLREAQSGDYGTIVMGKRGLSGIKRRLLGSVSKAVLHGLTDQSIVLID